MKETVNINDYDALPTTPYRVFVDKIQDRIAFINTQSCSDDVRLELLKGALLGLLEIDPDSIVEMFLDEEFDPRYEIQAQKDDSWETIDMRTHPQNACAVKENLEKANPNCQYRILVVETRVL